MRRPRPLAYTICGLSLLGVFACATSSRPPSATLQRDLYPGIASLSESQVIELLDRDVALPARLRAGLLWLDEPIDPRAPDADAVDYERTGLVESALDALRGEPFHTITLVPTVARSASRQGGSPTLLALRSASAHFQSDVVILTRVSVSQPGGMNFLALSYLALLPQLFVPGDELTSYAAAEMCAIHVRSGIILACSVGRSLARDGRVLPWRIDDLRRSHREATLEAALREAAATLRSELGARVADGQTPG